MSTTKSIPSWEHDPELTRYTAGQGGPSKASHPSPDAPRWDVKVQEHGENSGLYAVVFRSGVQYFTICQDFGNTEIASWMADQFVKALENM